MIISVSLYIFYSVKSLYHLVLRYCKWINGWMKKKVLCQWPVGRLKTLLKPGIRKNLFYSLIYDFTTSFTTKDKLSFLLVNSRWICLHEYIPNIHEKLREGNMHVTNAIKHVTLRPRSHYTCIYITNNLAAATIISIICQK